MKPLWALTMQDARDMEQRAEMLRQEAMRLRCHTEDSGGARCTADQAPEHKHRHLQEDLP